jgi:hypothetical protein
MANKTSSSVAATRWCGPMLRMNEKRFPKKVSYMEMESKKRFHTWQWNPKKGFTHGNGRKFRKWKTSIKMGKLVWKCHTGKTLKSMKICCEGGRRLKDTAQLKGSVTG